MIIMMKIYLKNDTVFAVKMGLCKIKNGTLQNKNGTLQNKNGTLQNKKWDFAIKMGFYKKNGTEKMLYFKL